MSAENLNDTAADDALDLLLHQDEWYEEDGFVVNVDTETALADKCDPSENKRAEVDPSNIVSGKRRRVTVERSVLPQATLMVDDAVADPDYVPGEAGEEEEKEDDSTSVATTPSSSPASGSSSSTTPKGIALRTRRRRAT
jgi:hypothetical protein